MDSEKPYSLDGSFQWLPQPGAFNFIRGLVADFLAECPEAAVFADRMLRETGTRLIDWIDHIRLNRSDRRLPQLRDALYRTEKAQENCGFYENTAGVFPSILVWDGGTEIGIKVESVSDFLASNNMQREILGNPPGTLRTSRIHTTRDCAMTVLERHGTRAFDPKTDDTDHSSRRLVHGERFRTRIRHVDRDEDGFEIAARMIDDAIRDLGQDPACDLWFATEREFYMRRNRAAQAQKARQDKLGLGWANHDHHTYRSSRRNFKSLVAIWEKLGLQCRERFYAGREAGWGAQVMEQPAVGIVTFNDVDLAPDELIGDFSHDGLGERERLGTVGLWCGLHGDSFLQSGMHHLASKFDFDRVSKQLSDEAGVKMMPPFSDFPYLRQAFTEGERWKADPGRLERMQEMGAINPEQADQFQKRGAIGSHLENLERNDGFKGFNQAGVNEIIHATDPRKNIGA